MSPGSQRRRRRRQQRRRSVTDSADLLTEILIRLPVKTVITFQCVSKHWLAVISSADFRWKHTGFHHLDPTIYSLYCRHKFGNNDFVVPLSSNGPTRVPPVPFLDSTKFFIVVHSCNGLLLCRSKFHYVVCNPTTQNYALVHIQKGTAIEPYLAFDPSRSRFFKIVLLDHVEDHYLFRIYSSETDSWKVERVDASYQWFYDFYRRGVFWNGALHWVVDENYSVFRFDAHELTSRFYEQSSPDSDWIWHRTTRFPDLSKQIRYVGECRDRLLLVASAVDEYYGTNHGLINILEMDKNYTGWSKMYTLHQDSVLAPGSLAAVKTEAVVMYVLQAAEENEYELVFGVKDCVVSYNTKSKCLKQLPHTPDIKLKVVPVFGYCHVYPVVRCLLPVWPNNAN